MRLLRYTMWLLLAGGAGGLVYLYPCTTAGIVLNAIVLFPWSLGWLPGVWRRRAEGPPPAETDLHRRLPVWSALSELYLDTELMAQDHERIADVLLASGYGAEALSEILYREVHPVLWTNLLSVAGEWAAFDPEWLEEQILARRRQRASFCIVPAKWMVRDSWLAVNETLRRRE